MSLVSVPLDGNNYFWVRAIKFALGAKQKPGFIDGSCHKPTNDKNEIEQWQRTDCMVVSWILNSISKDIAEAFLYATSARDQWLELESSNAYDHVRSQVLLMDPLPTVGKAYSMFLRVEKQREVYSGISGEGVMATQFGEITRQVPTKDLSRDVDSLTRNSSIVNTRRRNGRPPNARVMNVQLEDGERSIQGTPAVETQSNLSALVRTEDLQTKEVLVVDSTNPKRSNVLVISGIID
ncbi:UNVERIFIED_CONTAM: hypothetical protein Scaly_2727500 [Sesamum calycinum]|uniref:Retrotransposon Copia-like N-terminal domain-containing protein n=1 Tax=Sesamum calycinum TaxID=2727403 RepID=A0AAW2J1T7_9LAMI